MIFLGCDPSQRHTGICIRSDSRVAFLEIKTGELDIFSSCLMIRDEFRKILAKLSKDIIFCIERQIVGASFSPLQFHIYHVVVEEFFYHVNPTEPRLVTPSPVQLKQYMARIHGIDTTSKRSIVDSYHKKYGQGRKKSSHKVEAFFLTRLAEDCLKGKWYYVYQERQTHNFPWAPIQGDPMANKRVRKKPTPKKKKLKQPHCEEDKRRLKSNGS